MLHDYSRASYTGWAGGRVCVSRPTHAPLFKHLFMPRQDWYFADSLDLRILAMQLSSCNIENVSLHQFLPRLKGYTGDWNTERCACPEVWCPGALTRHARPAQRGWPPLALKGGVSTTHPVLLHFLFVLRDTLSKRDSFGWHLYLTSEW